MIKWIIEDALMDETYIYMKFMNYDDGIGIGV